MIRGVVERFGGLGDGTFVMARQENLETIHQHNVVAERFGLLGELRRELTTGGSTCRTTRRCASGSTRPAADVGRATAGAEIAPAAQADDEAARR